MSAAAKAAPANPPVAPNAEHALAAIGLLFDPGDVIEIRALDVRRDGIQHGSIHAGYFNVENTQAIASAIRSVDGRAAGVYVVLNKLNPVLLALESRPEEHDGRRRHPRASLALYRCGCQMPGGHLQFGPGARSIGSAGGQYTGISQGARMAGTYPF